MPDRDDISGTTTAFFVRFPSSPLSTEKPAQVYAIRNPRFAQSKLPARPAAAQGKTKQNGKTRPSVLSWR